MARYAKPGGCETDRQEEEKAASQIEDAQPEYPVAPRCRVVVPQFDARRNGEAQATNNLRYPLKPYDKMVVGSWGDQRCDARELKGYGAGKIRECSPKARRRYSLRWSSTESATRLTDVNDLKPAKVCERVSTGRSRSNFERDGRARLVLCVCACCASTRALRECAHERVHAMGRCCCVLERLLTCTNEKVCCSYAIGVVDENSIFPGRRASLQHDGAEHGRRRTYNK